MTYLLLSAVFIGIAVAVAVVALVVRARRGRAIARWWIPLLAAAVLLVIFTAVFDNIMIAAGLMVYAPSKTSGLSIDSAPLEDFAYPIAAVLLLPAIWALLGRRGRRDP